MNFLVLFIGIIFLIISALPLYIAVKILGGEASILKVIMVNFLLGIIGAVLSFIIDVLAGPISFIIMLIAYKFAFDLGWIKAFFVWILQGIIMTGLMFGAIMIFGMSIASVLV